MSIEPTNPMHRTAASEPDAQKRSCRAVDESAMLPTCGARTRDGSPCRNLPMRNGRCRMHGGGSTGPRTAAGLTRSRTSTLVYGGRSREATEFRRAVRELREAARRTVELV